MNLSSARILAACLILLWQAISTGSALSQDVTPPPALKTEGQTSYADLAARSAALTPEQKADAQKLFSTGFSLWQSGDFAPASKAFARGLDIDPANAQANYYFGDCLKQTKQRKEAAEYFTRASKLGAGSPESFKAEAALEELSKPVSIAEMSDDEIAKALVGKWRLQSLTGDDHVVTIKSVSGKKLVLDSNWFYGPEDGLLDSNQISWINHQFLTPDIFWSLKLVSGDKMEGLTGLGAPTYPVVFERVH